MRETMLIFHFIGLTMGLGTGFAHAFLGSATAKMAPADATKFQMQTLVLSKMGHIGLALLLISGFYLITPYWKILPSNPLLIVKLALVAILIILLILIGIEGRKAKTGDAAVHLARMKQMGKLTLLVGLGIIVVAVNVFH